MPDEADNSAITEPEVIDDAPLDTAGGTGDEPVDRDAGFLKILEAAPETAEEVEEPTEPKPDETKEKVDASDAKNLPLEAPEDEDEDEDTILSREELDKRFSNSPKGLRKYADNLGRKYAPVAAIVDELGGPDAVKRLDAVSTLVMSSPSRPDAPEVVEYVKQLRATNPAFASQLNTNIFYGAIDEDPTLLESVIKTAIGPNWTGEKLKQIAALVDSGEIDLDEVQEVAQRKLPPEELARREAQSAADKKRDDEIAELRKAKEDTEANNRQAAIKADVDDLGKRFSEAREPVWRQFKLLPVEGDPEDVKKVKEQIIKEIILETSYELNFNPLFRSIDAMVNNQSKGDGFGWAVEKAAGMIRAKSREIGLRKLPLFTAFLKNYNQPAASNVTKRRPEPLAEGALATERAPSPTEQAQEPLSPEQRKANFQAMIEGKRQAQ